MSASDPFVELIVRDPRRPEPSVTGLNERPFQAAMARLAPLIAGHAPRPVEPAGPALLVTSEQPGYGKSHLIGRLVRSLHCRATVVYVPPFQGAASAFQAVLSAVVRELNFPERTTSGTLDAEAATQLDALAHGVLAHLLADLIEHPRTVLQIDASPETSCTLRHDPLGAFNRGTDAWAKWMDAHWPQLAPHFEAALAARGVELCQPASWLRVLSSYAFAPHDPAIRRLCIDWLTAQPLERDETAALGVRPMEFAGEESGVEQTNALARTRLVELCQLASFYRPFLLCFDQTEVYGHRAASARAFGLVIATLVHEAPNQLTLITANQDPWTQRVLPYLEHADRDRIAPPVALEGLNRAQAAELVRLRLHSAGVPPERRETFLNAKWLAQLFPAETSQMGTRFFLQRCRARWNEAPLGSIPLAAHYKQGRAKIAADPKRRLLEPEPLRWVIEEAAGVVPGIQVEPLTEWPFSIRWRTPERICLFGFTASSQWNHWRKLAQISVERNRTGGGLPVKCVYFRGPEDPRIPGPNWDVRAEIEAAQRETLHIITLTPAELADLYAARELYAEAAQGDIDYTPEQVLSFLHTQLGTWWERLRGPSEGPALANEVQLAASA